MRLILLTSAMLGLELSPFISVLPLGVPLLQYIGLATFLIAAGVSIAMDRWTQRPLYTIIFHPVGIMIMAWCMLRSGVLGRTRRGIIWRGTFYSTQMLRQGTVTGVKD